MIIWNIISEELECEVEVGPITVLKGSHELWFKLVRLIDDYFTNKNTEVQIYEDTQLLYKKDWECLFIPYDAHLQFDKINSKSPLKILLDEMSEELSYSPVYLELLSIWDELRDELDLVNTKIEKYGLTLKMESFGIDHLKDFLLFTATKNIMTPIEYKTMLLNLFADKLNDKKRLIIIELPELYANNTQFTEFINIVEQLSKMGIQFLIVTQKNLSGNHNYVFDEKIINEALLENMKRKVFSEVPFICENDLYEEAKDHLLKVVDNFVFQNRKLGLSTIQNEAIIVLLYVMINHLNIRIPLDMSGISPNLQAFVKSY
ncbi:hypothetical protein TEPIDINF_002683 [Tepidibacillus infernus]|uniref:hypothetical protein n=1 Tax=Tepidibacillus infernus TaxID=1806172 RepID=UPI003B722373